jgi:hypothetical protein
MAGRDQEVLVLIEASAQNAANVQAKRIDTLGGENTFRAGLSPTGNLPATHYWCNWLMSAEDKGSFINFLDALVRTNRAWIYDRATTTPQQVLAQHGLQPLRAFP